MQGMGGGGGGGAGTIMNMIPGMGGGGGGFSGSGGDMGIGMADMGDAGFAWRRGSSHRVRNSLGKRKGSVFPRRRRWLTKGDRCGWVAGSGKV